MKLGVKGFRETTLSFKNDAFLWGGSSGYSEMAGGYEEQSEEYVLGIPVLVEFHHAACIHTYAFW
jgi:hypothetical protein